MICFVVIGLQLVREWNTVTKLVAYCASGLHAGWSVVLAMEKGRVGRRLNTGKDC